GVVNGHKLELADLEERTKQVKAQYQSYGYGNVDDNTAREQAWNGFVGESVMDAETDKMGLAVTGQELNDMLYVHPSDDIKQVAAYKNQQTGEFDPNLLKQQIDQIRKGKEKEYKEGLDRYLVGLTKNRLQQKFASLLSNTVYYPKWMLEKLNSDNSTLASASYVHVPYSTVSDSSIKVSDDDVSDYVNKHKEEYQQPEGRSIAYVVFDASASAEDTANLKGQLENLKHEFATIPASDLNAFMARNASQSPFLDAFVAKTSIQVPFKDSIMALPNGGIFGPYVDASSIVLAKKIDERIQFDSVKARHILIATEDPQSGQRILDDSTAEKRIDSIKTAIEHGARFDSLASQLSDDRNSRVKGGDLGYFTSGRMVKAFNDFCFSGKKGERSVVKSEFGYHYIEIEDQKNPGPAYKIAYLSKPIVSSQNTQDKANGLASQFAAECRTAKAFDDNSKKRNYNKLLAGDIKPQAADVPGIGTSRQLVKWVYDAERGDVSEVFNIDSKYVVAMVTEINKEGVMSPAKARPLVEYILKNKKKAEQIKNKIGSATTLEAVAAATSQTVAKADSIKFSAPFFPNAGQESKVGGYIFNAGAKGKVSPAIAGNSGVYVVRTENIYAVPNDAANVEQQRQGLIQSQRMQGLSRVEAALKKAATIKDYRSRFF
ncbi:MAG TPA: peptidylprolyl isomerase, partial [Chitinophagaceae bacterium]|nr:peptidylprolyl isomerase [Chitinophagaceae bacterium]